MKRNFSSMLWEVLAIPASLLGLALALLASQATAVRAEANATSFIYLPMTVHVPPPPPALVNGDFEAGETGWTAASDDGHQIIRTDMPVGARSGQRAAWLGGTYNDITSITQEVTISSAAPYLVYWYYLASADFCGYDEAHIFIGPHRVQSFELCDDTDTHGWVRGVIDLRPYTGQTLDLQFRAETDWSLNSNFFVDDVSFESSPAAVQQLETAEPLQQPSPAADEEVLPGAIAPAEQGEAKPTQPTR